MSRVTSRASRSSPCPVCASPSKGCSITEDGLHLCRGEPGDGWRAITRQPDGAGYHHYRRADDTTHLRTGQRPAAPPKVTDWGALARRLAGRMTDETRAGLVRALGLPVAALQSLDDVGYSPDDPNGACWTLPERDSAGRVVGVTRRYAGGRKMQMAGGRRGLTIPVGWRERPGPVVLVEGASDVLALSWCGVAAVGRPSNTGGVEMLVDLLRGTDRDVIVLGERDAKPDGQWPGRDGATQTAQRLTAALGRPVRWSMPPDGIKDARAWVLDIAAGWGEGEEWAGAGREILAHLAKPPAVQTDAKSSRCPSRYPSPNSRGRRRPSIGSGTAASSGGTSPCSRPS